MKSANENAGKILESKSKPERAEFIAGLHMLDNRRFLLSASPDARIRLKKLETAFDQIKINYPEFFGLTIYGSHTKGYAQEASDFDGHFFVDTDKALASFDPDNLQPKDFINEEDFGILFLSQARAFDKETKKRFAISEAMLIKYKTILDYYLKQNNIENAVGNKKLKLEFLDEDYVRRCAASDEDLDYASESLIALFNLSLDRDINYYRAIVIDQFKSEGITGLKKWERLMRHLSASERLENGEKELFTKEKSKQRYAKLYPTLDKAVDYFLQGGVKE